jgi:hypothetical protein
MILGPTRSRANQGAPMEPTFEQLSELVEAAERAYERARIEVFDQVTLRALSDPLELTAQHRDAIERLNAAETAVAECRADMHIDVAVPG